MQSTEREPAEECLPKHNTCSGFIGDKTLLIYNMFRILNIADSENSLSRGDFSFNNLRFLFVSNTDCKAIQITYTEENLPDQKGSSSQVTGKENEKLIIYIHRL